MSERPDLVGHDSAPLDECSRSTFCRDVAALYNYIKTLYNYIKALYNTHIIRNYISSWNVWNVSDYIICRFKV